MVQTRVQDNLIGSAAYYFENNFKMPPPEVTRLMKANRPQFEELFQMQWGGGDYAETFRFMWEFSSRSPGIHLNL